MCQPLIFIYRSKNNIVELIVDANFAPSLIIFTVRLPLRFSGEKLFS